MISWLAKRVISHNLARLRAGDPRPTLRLESKHIHMRFPGTNSFAVDLHGKAQHELWLRRLVEVGVQLHADEVLVKGFPWNMTVCVRGRGHARSPEGELVYENRYVIWGRMAWGLIREYEVYEDTEQATVFDNWLSARQASVPVSA